jgi:DNA-binding NarL/FixJ family response regulator
MIRWQQLLSFFRFRRDPGSRHIELNESLHAALMNLADREQRPAEQIQADLLAAGLAQHHIRDELWQCWESLTPRERDATALACLGHTNRQIAARLHISVETVKTHIHNALTKFSLHSKAELRLVFSEWDFNAWDIPQQ